MTATDFLLWVKGPGFTAALVILVVGVAVRLLEIFMLGRPTDIAEPRGSEMGPGLKTIVTRSVPYAGIFRRAPFNVVVGYVWHVGFFVCLFLLAPHIELIHGVFGLSWPALPTPLVDATAVITIGGLVAMLVHRIRHPVMRMLSGFEDYLTWALTLAPILTGYLAYHHAIHPYALVLGLHILSVEVLMVVFPFTKLMHAITVFPARWYNGAIAGRKGVES